MNLNGLTFQFGLRGTLAIDGPTRRFSLENEICDSFDAAKILNLKVLNVNLRVEPLLEVKQQVHKLLGVKNPCVQQVRGRRWHINIKQISKQFSYLSLNILVFNG
jgi:hypothetical protein